MTRAQKQRRTSNRTRVLELTHAHDIVLTGGAADAVGNRISVRQGLASRELQAFQQIPIACDKRFFLAARPPLDLSFAFQRQLPRRERLGVGELHGASHGGEY